jgi:hypothetical protein
MMVIIELFEPMFILLGKQEKLHAYRVLQSMSSAKKNSIITATTTPMMTPTKTIASLSSVTRAEAAEAPHSSVSSAK